MKIYDAIRKGAMRHKQTVGWYFDYLASGMIIGTCALGAALVAALENTTHKRIETMQDFVSAMDSLGFEEYEKEEAISYFFDLNDETSWKITHWNDEQRLSREEIANRLEEMEA